MMGYIEADNTLLATIWGILRKIWWEKEACVEGGLLMDTKTPD
jgi:hypothetical protein